MRPPLHLDRDSLLRCDRSGRRDSRQVTAVAARTATAVSFLFIALLLVVVDNIRGKRGRRD